MRGWPPSRSAPRRGAPLHLVPGEPSPPRLSRPRVQRDGRPRGQHDQPQRHAGPGGRPPDRDRPAGAAVPPRSTLPRSSRRARAGSAARELPERAGSHRSGVCGAVAGSRAEPDRPRRRQAEASPGRSSYRAYLGSLLRGAPQGRERLGQRGRETVRPAPISPGHAAAKHGWGIVADPSRPRERRSGETQLRRGRATTRQQLARVVTAAEPRVTDHRVDRCELTINDRSYCEEPAPSCERARAVGSETGSSSPPDPVWRAASQGAGGGARWTGGSGWLISHSKISRATGAAPVSP